MRCHQAKHKLLGSGRDDVDPTTAAELLEHIQNCPACANEAESVGELRRIIQLAADDDGSEMIPIAKMQKIIESRTTGKYAKRGGTASFTFRLKPLLASGLAVTVTAVLMLMFVPFDYMDTIGYKVALAGVNPELVEGDEQICDMLVDAGLYEVAIDILGCDTTCSLLVLDLKTRQEAQIVVAAVSDGNSPNLMTDIIAVQANRSATFLDRVINK